MKVARIYLRVSTEEQDLSRQDAIVKSTQAAGFYVAGQQQAHKMLTFRETVIPLAYIGTVLANTRSFRKPAETFMKFGHIGIGLCFIPGFSGVAPDSA